MLGLASMQVIDSPEKGRIPEGMANGAAKRGSKSTGQQSLVASERLEGPATATLELSLDDLMQQPLPDNLPHEMFTGPGLLALADLLPVMTAKSGEVLDK
ncbi:MAG TPA: hypothetical protein VK192_07580 [Sphingomicrobium sp.]|nr:hypothetical protein [Sphingomicrobium sp.]